MIKKPLNILVTAVGSPLGQSIGKALAMSTLPLQIYRSDISLMAAGLYMGKKTKPIILPVVRAPHFDTVLKNTVRQHHIDCIFPVLEIEHDYFHREKKWFSDQDVHIVTGEKDILDRCYDKFSCMAHLAKNGIPVPDTVAAQRGVPMRMFLEKHAFPLFLKPRYGASNTDTFVVSSKKHLSSLMTTRPENYFILQTYLSHIPEYTVGVYRSRDGSFERTCVIERDLKFGLSYRGTVIRNEKISAYALSVARTLGLTFSSNVQLRIDHGVPKAFEINPRLSSTTSVRAHFGFNEPELILLELFESIKTYRKKQTYGSFVRSWEEHYLPKTIHL